jgi:hypothetical protein
VSESWNRPTGTPPGIIIGACDNSVQQANCRIRGPAQPQRAESQRAVAYSTTPLNQGVPGKK